LKITQRLGLMDRRLLEIAQNEFPLTLRPWASIANKLGITEEEVLQRISKLCNKGIIRKVGPALDPGLIGLRASTLIAMRVPRNKIQKVARLISNYEEVSHFHQREHEYNFWFTLTTKNEVELKRITEEITRETRIGEDDMLDLHPIKIFKIDVRFQLT